MPQVVIEDPMSFKVQDFLNAYAHAMKSDLILTNPKTRLRILNTRINVPNIGLAFIKTDAQQWPLGFRTSASIAEEDDDNEYEDQALLIFDVDPASLPESLVGESWVLQVYKYEDENKFLETVKALAEKFNVNIVISSATKADPDPLHPDEEKTQAGMPICPVFVRHVIEVPK